MPRITLKGKAADLFMRAALKANEPPVAGASACSTAGWKSLCVDCIKNLSLSWSDSSGGNVHAPCERCGKWTHLRMVRVIHMP